jgi:dipeptide transport system ATP-binding protein
MSLLRVENLSVEFPALYGDVRVVDNFSLQMAAGEVHGLVGESGSGKSLAALAVLGLLDPIATRWRCDHLSLNDQDLLRISASERRRWQAKYASVIFQDAQASLNPSFTIGEQLDEVIKLHHGGGRVERRERAADLLHQVGLHNIAPALASYPHQFSTGMNQRAMIALALACEPALLIADEPTTGLDVTIQAQLLELLLKLNSERGMGLLLITHDIALLARNVERITVMYCGQVVESGDADDVFLQSRHPYTRSLLDSLPKFEQPNRRLHALRGAKPSMLNLPVGCYFGPRCPRADRDCVHSVPMTDDGDHRYRCLFPLGLEPRPPESKL